MAVWSRDVLGPAPGESPGQSRRAPLLGPCRRRRVRLTVIRGWADEDGRDRHVVSAILFYFRHQIVQSFVKSCREERLRRQEFDALELW